MYREKVICTCSVVDKLITDLQEVSWGIDPFCIHVWTKALVLARPGEGLAPLGLTQVHISGALSRNKTVVGANFH